MLIFKAIFTYLIDLRVKRQGLGIVSDKRNHIFQCLKGDYERKEGGGVGICIVYCVLKVICMSHWGYDFS